uniref:Uncharacterized protein n=1 Tax=Junco hyemalis TaxID=40217 RepID=A0A8C5J8C3_JUNHY
ILEINWPHALPNLSAADLFGCTVVHPVTNSHPSCLTSPSCTSAFWLGQQGHAGMLATQRCYIPGVPAPSSCLIQVRVSLLLMDVWFASGSSSQPAWNMHAQQ